MKQLENKVETLSLESYLVAVFKQTSDSTRNINFEVLHPEIENLVGTTPVMRPALADAFQRYISSDAHSKDESFKSFSADHTFSEEIRYAYLKHEELSLKNLLSHTLPARMILEEEYIKQADMQMEQIIHSETERINQLEQYVKAMENKESETIKELDCKWKTTLNNKLSSLI